ncbi:hypothetical protein [Methylobacterium marchantiae]|uniref:Uncharacterized protein n=1 Tax=Methylobacterium marchantiae TaxID=600331 RepID=A0ABW3X4P1_9HYPH
MSAGIASGSEPDGENAVAAIARIGPCRPHESAGTPGTVKKDGTTPAIYGITADFERDGCRKYRFPDSNGL